MATNDCCETGDSPAEKTWKSFDYILWGSTGTILLASAAQLILAAAGHEIAALHHFVAGVWELLGTMWWGLAIGLLFVGLMSKIPREYFMAVLGRGDTFGGLLRAALGGVLLDLCSHGILMVGAKLYERGASAAQVMTFLIASPWNSLSLTIILIALIGLKWTLLYIAGSVVIAVATGVIFQRLVARGTLPGNPHDIEMPEGFSLKDNLRRDLKNFRPSLAFFKDIATGGLHEARMILRWLLFGTVLAGAIRAFIPPEMFAEWFGPTLIGLFLTLVATTIIEVCSEGSAPIASEIVNRAGAPGNGFAFLMAGVATDYTEIMVLRDFTKSWKIALFLPLVTVPQVLAIGWIMNLA